MALLADEFFKRGISDYIGTAWEVPSQPAKLFASKFYEAVLGEAVRLGEAMQRARSALYQKRASFGEHGSAWGAYQHYGDPTNKLELRTGR